MLELVELTHRFPNGEEPPITIADGLSLRVAAGELAAVYGPSGSGKTTVLLMAAGIERPERGRVLLDGREIGDLAVREADLLRRRELGLVWQSFGLQPRLSAIDNAAFKLLAEGWSLRRARAELMPLMARVGLASRAYHLPGELSAGERQRVAIVRALANRPRLLLADEPTGNLDAQRSRAVLELLAELCREQRLAAILATHDAQAAEFADRVYRLADGRLEETTGERPPALVRTER